MNPAFCGILLFSKTFEIYMQSLRLKSSLYYYDKIPVSFFIHASRKTTQSYD